MPRVRWAVVWIVAVSVVPSVALAQSSAPTDRSERARASFELGLTAADELRWTDAVSAFEESLALEPTSEALRNLALSHRAVGRYRTAIGELERLDAGGGLTEDERTRVHQIVDELPARLGSLEVSISPVVDGATIRVDDERAELMRRLPLDPGRHRVMVSAPHYETRVLVFDLQPTENRRVDLALTASVSPIVRRPMFWVGLGLGTAVVVAGAATLAAWLTRPAAPPDCGGASVCVSLP